MREHQNKEGYKVIEYSFADWENGLLSGVTAPYTNRKITNTKTKEVYFETLPKTEFDKILEASKEVYRACCTKRTNELTNSMYIRLNASENKPLLLKQEQETITILLTSPSPVIVLGNTYPLKGSNYKGDEIASIRKLYQQLVVNGKKDYIIITYPNIQFTKATYGYWHIETEALAQHLKFLESFDLDKYAQSSNSDVDYTLNFDFYEDLKPDSTFKFVNRQLTQSGLHTIKFNGDIVKLYNAALAYLFIVNEPISAFNRETKLHEQIDGFQFFADYLSGYRNGQAYFNANYTPSTDTMYGTGARIFIHDLHTHYFHTEHEKCYKGWKGFAIDSFPLNLSHAFINKYGYYAGIISEMNELKLKYPNQFKDFDKCVKNDTVTINKKPTSLKPKPLPAKPQTLRDIWEGDQVSYDRLIKLLKDHQPNIGTSFITEIDGKLVWNKQPAKGFAQYIAGMFHILIKKGWIKDQYTAPKLVSVVNETFNIIISDNPLKTVGVKYPKERYTNPFKSLANNLK